MNDPHDQTTIAKNEFKTDFSANQSSHEETPSPVIEPQGFESNTYFTNPTGTIDIIDNRSEAYSAPQISAQNQAPIPFPTQTQSSPQQEISNEQKIASISAWLKSLPSGPPQGINDFFGNNKPAEAEKPPSILKQTPHIGPSQKSGSLFDSFRERMAKKAV
jgi:hypothetical protein